eukprot:TRINITY_DN40345_c0_g1_i1.p1 TRINITY_DN40345_c0_g1~~TRINITY_DN40345_c0_g1_i1.p1  ORF type:complete len:151 (+),score=3.28 TRINITY_DN40345_c0_g1_i1:69-455(+)
MTHVTVEANFTTTAVVRYRDVVFGFPVEAGDGLVAIVIRLSSIVLPVVGVDALRRFVFSEVEGTELGFIVEHVEIFVFFVVVNQVGKNFLFIMGKRTKITIGALIDSVWVMEAKVFFVLVLMVMLLHR